MRLSVRLRTLVMVALIGVSLLPTFAFALLNQWEQRHAEPAPAATSQLWFILALGSLSTACAIAVGRGVADLIEGPLVGLLATSDDLAKSKNKVQVPAAVGMAPLEVKALVSRFKDLTTRLVDTQNALTHANQDLESRVAHRTEELAQRNLDLGYSRATLYAVMESMTNGLVLVTPDRRIRYINRHTEDLLHLKEPFYPGRSADELYTAVAKACEEPSETRHQVDQSIADPSFIPILKVDRHAEQYLAWRTFPIRNSTGANLGVGHILTDVTQAHELDRVKSELISTVSHELRTPLTAIRASISSLLRPNVEWDDETRADFLATISEESKHLQELIESWLDMSKIEAGVLRLDRHTTDLARLIDGVLIRARALYPDWGLTPVVAPGLPPIAVDSRRIEQVLLNLVDNAVKYGAESRNLAIWAERHEAEIWLSVHDKGLGIPPEHIDLIFDRFHRVDSKLNRNTGGNGLGLAICQGIVKAHGGRIWAESELGKGSVFYVALPIVQEE